MIDRHSHRYAQVKAWADCRRQYVLRIGDRVIGYDCLTDEAFQDLRNRIASDWWFERKLNRQNRAIHEHMKATADRIAEMRGPVACPSFMGADLDAWMAGRAARLASLPLAAE